MKEDIDHSTKQSDFTQFRQDLQLRLRCVSLAEPVGGVGRGRGRGSLILRLKRAKRKRNTKAMV